MTRMVLITVIFGAALLTGQAAAATVAYWRFEEGPWDAPVAHPVAAGAYYAAALDSSGNGNALSAWNESWAGFSYQSDAAFAMVPQTGAANRYSLRNLGSLPSMWTRTSDPINSISPLAFTIEVTFKLESGGVRTLVGRDSYGKASSNPAFSALYLQVLSDNAAAIKFCDVSGRWHEAVSSPGAIATFDNASNPNGIGAAWYSLAAVSDGQQLSLYLADHDRGTGYCLMARTDMTQSGSPNRALTAGSGDGGDWDAGNWTVGRGLYNGAHCDRAYGMIDEIRISNTALKPSEFLGSSNVSQTAAYWRFEDGPAGQRLRHPAAGGTYYPAVSDSSGHRSDLSVWDEGGAGYSYQADLGFTRVDGQPNNFCVRNNGPAPAMWTAANAPVSLISPAAFTVEATFKLENGDYRTIVGRDSYGTAGSNAALAALYFQALPNNQMAIKFCDVSGYWHEAVSAAGAIGTFDYASNPDGLGVPWYSMAGVSNGATLSLYLRNVTAGGAWQLIAQTDLTASGSPNTALTAGAGDGSDWDAGSWSVGRGLYNGVHEDRAWGFIDEVRISTCARGAAELLYCEVPGGSDWMGLLNGNLSLSQISMPGTHDSGARYEPVAGTAKCQDLTISQQLSAGVRFLDIRCRHINDSFTIHHGSVYQNINFGDVLSAVLGFLDTNPSESVLMSVKEEYTSSNVTRSFEETFSAYRQQNPDRWYLKEAVPTISQARRKIVLLRRFGASQIKGISATNWPDNTTFTIANAVSQLRVQDYYNVSSAGAKWNSVLAMLNEAPNGGQNVLYLSFSSGYTTGLFGIPSITSVSNSVNPQLVSYFSAADKKRFGIIAMDFADSQKAALIMQTNFRIIAGFEAADITGDGFVDYDDLMQMAGQWLQAPSDRRADLVPDLFIDLNDLAMLSRYYPYP